jgi:hypothetical protein
MGKLAAGRAGTRLEQTLAAGSPRRDDRAVEPPIEHRDVTTIMALLGDIKNDVRRIRTLLEDENGEEEEEGREPHS